MIKLQANPKAQISFSFSGGFWPISFPLFHGTARPSALGTVLVSAYMNGSFVVERSLILIVDQGRLSTLIGRSMFIEAFILIATMERRSLVHHGEAHPFHPILSPRGRSRRQIKNGRSPTPCRV